MYKALIVEDDQAAADALASYLARFGEEHGTSFAITHFTSALDLLDGKQAADVVFLDIGLPGISGMEAAEIWRQKDEVTPIVFVTDLAQYAVRGYQVDALDFMVKPVAWEDFSLRMGRVMRVLSRNAASTVTIALPGGGMRVARQQDIVFVEILKHDLYWHIAGEKDALRVRGTLSQAQEELDATRFCRISASHLINMGQVTRVQAGAVLMSDGSELTFSRSRKRESLEALARFAGGGA